MWLATKQFYTFYSNHISTYINNLRKLANRNNVKFRFEEVPFIMQASGFKMCGAYTIYYMMKLKECDQNNLSKIFSRFDRKRLKNNDSKVVSFVAAK